MFKYVNICLNILSLFFATILAPETKITGVYTYKLVDTQDLCILVKKNNQTEREQEIYKSYKRIEIERNTERKRNNIFSFLDTCSNL